tara:strand:+ start:484 stop:747 length:264 start_codon:yes stop_codon:yes gene_type:complete
MRVVPDWKEMGFTLRWVVTCMFIGFMLSFVVISCADEWYIGESREELAREMFRVDSLIMEIKYSLDSTSIDFEKFYIDAQRINNGHN